MSIFSNNYFRLAGINPPVTQFQYEMFPLIGSLFKGGAKLLRPGCEMFRLVRMVGGPIIKIPPSRFCSSEPPVGGIVICYVGVPNLE